MLHLTVNHFLLLSRNMKSKISVSPIHISSPLHDFSVFSCYRYSQDYDGFRPGSRVGFLPSGQAVDEYGQPVEGYGGQVDQYGRPIGGYQYDNDVRGSQDDYGYGRSSYDYQ